MICDSPEKSFLIFRKLTVSFSILTDGFFELANDLLCQRTFLALQEPCA